MKAATTALFAILCAAPALAQYEYECNPPIPLESCVAYTGGEGDLSPMYFPKGYILSSEGGWTLHPDYGWGDVTDGNPWAGPPFADWVTEWDVHSFSGLSAPEAEAEPDFGPTAGMLTHPILSAVLSVLVGISASISGFGFVFGLKS